MERKTGFKPLIWVELTLRTRNVAIIDSQIKHGQITLVIVILAAHFIIGQMIYTQFDQRCQ